MLDLIRDRSRVSLLDNRYSIETPEGIDLTIPIAGPVVRILAYGIDLSIRLGIQIGLSLTLYYLGKVGIGVLLISFFFVEWFYSVLFEVLNSGMTPGKKSMGIMVTHDDSTPVTWSSSITRNLLRVVDFLPICYMTGIVSMVFSREFKRLGDLAAGTLVVYHRNPTEAPVLPSHSPCRSPIPLTLSEQRAILNFAERHTALSPDRSRELANILKDVIGRQGAEAVIKLYQIANGLLGRNETENI